MELRRRTAGYKWKTNKGGERQVGAIQAKEAASMDAPSTPAKPH